MLTAWPPDSMTLSPGWWCHSPFIVTIERLASTQQPTSAKARSSGHATQRALSLGSHAYAAAVAPV